MAFVSTPVTLTDFEERRLILSVQALTRALNSIRAYDLGEPVNEGFLHSLNCVFIKHDFPVRVDCDDKGNLKCQRYELGRKRWNKLDMLKAVCRLFNNTKTPVHRSPIALQALVDDLTEFDAGWRLRPNSPGSRKSCSLDYF